jgi:L-lactate utilization protein LutC
VRIKVNGSSPGPDRSKVSAQQERNNQAAVREAQAFNEKKEETINRIKEAQPKQSPIKTFFNRRLQKHFDQNQMLKDAVARGEITPEQSNKFRCEQVVLHQVVHYGGNNLKSDRDDNREQYGAQAILKTSFNTKWWCKG